MIESTNWYLGVQTVFVITDTKDPFVWTAFTFFLEPCANI